ncbi:MAG: threonine synthase, partial [Prolixibacteraceae bacterium]|nr:threonine synthase [Prolixibacteraceae bacterium]
MKYYSTNRNSPEVSLQEAVIKGLAADRGLYMPEHIKRFDQTFFDNISQLDFKNISLEVAAGFFSEDVDPDNLREIVFDTLQFDCPVIKITDNIYS